jgi:uncharacterized protein YbjT (DUF2867 family)
MSILVIGATGTIGSATVNALLARGVKDLRVGVRSTEKAQVLQSKGATPVDFEWSNADKINAAVKGVKKVFLITPFDPNQVELAKQFIDAAKAAGVSHIVKLSAIGCEIEPGIQLGRWHRAVEKYIEASGIAYTFLRPNNFNENFLNYYPPGPDGNIYLPFADGKVSWIDGKDIGEAAAIALTTEGHANKAYSLTGPEALGVAEVAAILSEVSGSNIRYVDVPESAAREGMFKSGAPEWMVSAMMELHAVDKAGYAGAVTGELQGIIGRAPTTFKAFAQANAAKFKR